MNENGKVEIWYELKRAHCVYTLQIYYFQVDILQNLFQI